MDRRKPDVLDAGPSWSRSVAPAARASVRPRGHNPGRWIRRNLGAAPGRWAMLRWEAVMNAYPPIEDHGLIGDLQTAALVATDATIDWFCAPRFDSPSIFASLLDHERGGYFRVAPDRDDYVTKQLYLPGTPILITRFMCAEGVGEVVDFMPIAGDEATDRHRIVRMVRVVRGELRF